MTEKRRPAETLSQFIQEQKKALVDEWRHRVLQDAAVPKANSLDEETLNDHMPHMLDQLVEFMGREQNGLGKAGGMEIGTAESAKHHAQLRFECGFTLAESLREFMHFRNVLVEAAGDAGVDLTGEMALLVHSAIDEAMITGAEKMAEFSRADLEKTGQFRELFIGMLGHDLRNPVGAIKNYAQFALRMVDQPDPKYREISQRSLSQIARSAERINHLIQDLLDFTAARLGGGLELHTETLDLGEICQMVVDEQQVLFPGRIIHLETKGRAWGDWDRSRIYQMVSNLVNNALKYSPDNSLVELELTEEEQGSRLSVHNQGQPIAPELLEGLFDPFKLARQRATMPGTHGLGLGLYIVKAVVEAHGGWVGVRSQAEEGTTFTVYLPQKHPI